MEEIEHAYLMGVEAARESILAELAMAEHLAMSQHGAMLEAASQEEALHAAVQAEQSGLEQIVAEAYQAGMAAAAAPEDLQREEAYQIGVAIAEAEAMLETLKQAQGEMSDDLRSASTQGYDACCAARGGGESTSAPKKRSAK